MPHRTVKVQNTVGQRHVRLGVSGAVVRNGASESGCPLGPGWQAGVSFQHGSNRPMLSSVRSQTKLSLRQSTVYMLVCMYPSPLCLHHSQQPEPSDYIHFNANVVPELLIEATVTDAAVQY